MAYAEHIVTLHAPVKVRRTMVLDGVERSGLVDTTVGSIIFNTPVPQKPGLCGPHRSPPTGWITRSASGSPRRPCPTLFPAA